ncbi:MAG: CoA transferase, partial [Alphaproteobacteria bacterium]
EAMANEQLVARDMVVEVDNPEDGRLAQFALPVKFSDFEFEVTRPAPGHGDHTDEVLTELGLSDVEVAALRGNAVL